MDPGLMAVTLDDLLRQCPLGVRPQDARDWLLFLLDRPRVYLRSHGDTGASPALQSSYAQGLQRLQQGEPLAYLTGRQGFWRLELQVNADTLIPRPDTERLVELALQKMTAPTGWVLDLGTGSGAVALALAQERPDWQVVAVDIHAATLAVAAHNAARHGLEQVIFLQGSWFAALDGGRALEALPDWPGFDVVVSNPPYLDATDPHLTDLQHEPSRALVADEGGLADLHQIIAEAPDWLRPEGWLLLEHGWTQGAAVRNRMQQGGWQAVQTLQDYGGQDRVTLGQWCVGKS